MFKSIVECIKKAGKIYEDLQNEVPAFFLTKTLNPITCYSYCFRIMIWNNVIELSISYTPYNYGDFYCETALIFQNDLYYSNWFGYDDVKRFYSKKELMDEIFYLYSKLLKYKYIFIRIVRLWRRSRKEKHARRNIYSFIIRYKDHYLSKPKGLYYYRALTNFEKLFQFDKYDDISIRILRDI